MAKVLCRGWTEADIVAALLPATDLERSVLRSIALNPGTDVHKIAAEIGAKNYLAVSSALGTWDKNRVQPLGIHDPADGQPSWPMYVVRERRNGRLLWRYTMLPAVARVVVAHT